MPAHTHSQAFYHTPHSIDTAAKCSTPKVRKGVVAPNWTGPSSLCYAGKDPPEDDGEPWIGGKTVEDRKPTFRLNDVPE